MYEDENFVLLPDQTYCDTNTNERGDSDGDQQNDNKGQYNSFPDDDQSLVEYSREMEKILRKIKNQEISKWHIKKYRNERKILNDMPIQHPQPKQQKPPNGNVPDFSKKKVQFTTSNVETDIKLINTNNCKDNLTFSKSPSVRKTDIIAHPQRGPQTDFLHRPLKSICESDITPLSQAKESINAMSDTIHGRITETARSEIDYFPPLLFRENENPCNLEIILNTIAVNGLDKVNIFNKILVNLSKIQKAGVQYVKEGLDVSFVSFNLLFYFQDQPPPLPPKRSYEIIGVGKVSFPHLKTLAASFHEPPHQIMNKGQYKIKLSS